MEGSPAVAIGVMRSSFFHRRVTSSGAEAISDAAPRSSERLSLTIGSSLSMASGKLASWG